MAASSTLKALMEPVPVLAQVNIQNLCKFFLEGSCVGRNCPPELHRICRVHDATAVTSKKSLGAMNKLSATTQDVRKDFETDGPGDLSAQGPRHDNDHVEIGDIRILPTTDEILNARMPYMPQKSSDTAHRYEHGVQRYLDIQFRQLRYESTASILDACQSGLRLATEVSSNPLDFRQETANGVKYGFFGNVGVEQASFQEHKGAMFQISYDCPAAFQGRGKMTKAPFFEQGMLCALVAVHHKTQEVNVIFLQVHMRQSTETMRSKTGSHQKGSILAVLADPDDGQKVIQLTYYLRKHFDASMYLVDMPNVLVTSFQSHLKVLQELSVTEDFAFKQYLAAENPTNSIHTQWGDIMPAPTELAHEGWFNLNKLKKDKSDVKDLKLHVAPIDTFTHMNRYLPEIKERSTLDDGQAVALFEILSREMAFTQGPPGTGKTFLGVAAVETLLNSRTPGSLSPPIVVICQTNHALDDFIEELIERGITKVTRLGGGSNAKWIESYLLRNQRAKRQRPGKEIAKACAAKHQVDTILNQATLYAEALNEKDVVPWALIESYLCKEHPDVFKHFATLDCSSAEKATTDVRAAKMQFGFSFMYWQEGGDIRDANGLISAFEHMLGESNLISTWTAAEVATLREEVSNSFKTSVKQVATDEISGGLWSLDQAARKELASKWFRDSNPLAVCDTFAELHRRFRAVKDNLGRVFDEGDAMTIIEQKTEVIGMTSTASATMRRLLKKLAPQVILFEEASELIEAHTTIALVPSVQHCIQIGDPLQLRPHIQQQQLSTEHNPCYGLDVSLFERFMKSGMPFSKLNTQRRAHPEIADLLRVGDYNFLVDHSTTKNRPAVSGMASRIWWFDHNVAEDPVDRLSLLSKSASNQYEVQFVSAFVKYLVEKQGYKFREITVLTPYKGQLAALEHELSRLCTVALTEKDRDDMIDAHLIEDKEYLTGTSMSVSLSDMLRIATIDNYQGEQARVVIFSAVRSNTRNSVGFLANHNRTNVAISRAEDGFYVIGNSKLMEQDEHWAKVIACFKEKSAIGTTIKTQCQTHPHFSKPVSSSKDFENADCKEPCNQCLPCGHLCLAPCHPLEMHIDGRMPCYKPCTKKRACGHGCGKLCNSSCGSCTAIIKAVTLPCGHCGSLRCGEKAEAIACQEVVETVELKCGHSKSVLCSSAGDEERDECSEPCRKELACGHVCAKNCSECFGEKTHSDKCRVLCGQKLDCGHVCGSSCHHGACPPCSKTCEKSCQHGRCDHACHESCKPCTKARSYEGCTHSTESHPDSLCYLPRLSVPCSQVCGKLLKCGLHNCPGLCGEACPHNCEECATGSWPSIGTITLPCKHMFDVKKLDKRFGLDKIYQYDEDGQITALAVTAIPKVKDLNCPTCGSPTHKSRRYELAHSLEGLQHNVEQLVTLCSRKLAFAYREVSMGENILFAKMETFLSSLRFGPMSVTGNRWAIDERSARLIDGQQTAAQQKKIVTEIEQSINNTYQRLNSKLFPTAISSFSLRFDLLYFWSRLAIIEFAHRIAGRFGTMDSPDLQNRLMIKGYTLHTIEQAVGECAALSKKIEECKAKDLPRLEVELRILQLCLWSILQAHRATSRVDLDLEAAFARIRNLMKCFPKSAGLFEKGFEKLQKSIEGRHLAPRFWELGSARSSALWHELGKYEGELTLCRHKHAYSPIWFKDGCPECGHEIAYVEPKTLERKDMQAGWGGEISLTADIDDFRKRIDEFLRTHSYGTPRTVPT